MKATVLVLFFLVTICEYERFAVASSELRGTKTQQEGRNLVSLADQWNIGEPTYETDGLNFVIDYPLSTFIDQKMAYYDIYDENCEDLFVMNESFTKRSLVDVAPGSIFDEANFSIDGKSARAEIAIDPSMYSIKRDLDATNNGQSTIALDNDIDNDNVVDADANGSAANKDTAGIAFCVRFGLQTLGPVPIEVNFLETIVRLSINKLSIGFSLDAVQLSPKEKEVTTATESYNVEAFFCEPGSNNKISDDGDDDYYRMDDDYANTMDDDDTYKMDDDDTYQMDDDDDTYQMDDDDGYRMDDDADTVQQKPHTQGTMLTVCVQPDADARRDGVVMRSIDSFQWSKAGSIFQPAIESGVSATNLLTTYDDSLCRGAEYCQFSTLLMAAFYRSPGEVVGSGVATMQFETARNRRLEDRGIHQQTGDSEGQQDHHQIKRLLQEDTQGFGLTVEIEAVSDQRPNLLSRSSSSHTGEGLVVLGSGLVTIASLLW